MAAQDGSCTCTTGEECRMPGHDALRAELTANDRGDLLTTLMLGGIPDAGHVRAKIRPAVERIKAAAWDEGYAKAVTDAATGQPMTSRSGNRPDNRTYGTGT